MNSRATFQTPRRAPFDAAARGYDEREGSQEAFRLARALTHEVFLRHFEPGQAILELNCGTGTDAVHLARQGIRVLATDISRGMLQATEEKVRASGTQELVEVQQLGFDSLHLLQGRTFDGGFSNFGGLNCAHDIRPIALTLGMLIRPGGYFVATVMSDFCLWESVSMLLRLRWREAFRRRRRGGTLARIQGSRVPTYYHSPSAFARAFSDQFSTVEVVALNVFTPPPGHLVAHRLLRPVLPALDALDRRIAPLPFFRRIGDHYVIVLRRKSR